LLIGLLAMAAPSQSAAVEVVGDGSFENNGAPWTELASYPGMNFVHPGGPICPSCPLDVAMPRTGTGYVHVGGSYNGNIGPASVNHSASVSQTVTIPGGVATLRFWLSKGPAQSDSSTFTALVDGTPVHTDTITASTPYAEVVKDVSQFADGGAHTLTFAYAGSGSATGDQFTELYRLDDVSIDVQPPPDDDGDATPNSGDNCPALANPGQENTDGDADGDACDAEDDGDGVLDSSDPCPLLTAPTGSGGCPDLPRGLTLGFKRGAFQGTLSGPCSVSGQKVTLFAKKPGKDPRIGSDRTNDKGKFLVGARGRDGSYYAKAAEVTEATVGTCLAARSKILKLK
jgi:hypothetical protein